MSRAGYIDDLDDWSLIRWRGAVKSAIRGKRGQKFLKTLIEALDALPQKRLITGTLEEGGEVCAIGAVARHLGIPVDIADEEEDLDGAWYDEWTVNYLSRHLDIAPALVREVMNINDEIYVPPEKRWEWIRRWAKERLGREK